MSGGEQQMLAMGRALMAQPQLLLLDEPSLGLAPVIVDEIYEIIREINQQGMTILLVEQNANYALDVSARGYVLETGTVALTDESAALRDERASPEGVPGRHDRIVHLAAIGAKALLPALRVARLGHRRAASSPTARATARSRAWAPGCSSASSA